MVRGRRLKPPWNGHAAGDYVCFWVDLRLGMGLWRLVGLRAPCPPVRVEFWRDHEASVSE
jgi:hypothetical protein